MEAFARLAGDGVSARLRIVGSADARYPEAAETARRLGVADRVEWSGYLDEAGLVKAYQEADVLALLSKYEGFGLPVLEALACGTPVVCSNAASLPEVAGGAAWMVPPEDAAGAAAALKTVLTDAGTAARLREAGWRGRRRLPGGRRRRRCCACTGGAHEPELDRGAGARLAERHARRRALPGSDLPGISAGGAVHAAVPAGAGVGGDPEPDGA
jgi:glycosyltransferase involved in cell wall biosynthesis